MDRRKLQELGEHVRIPDTDIHDLMKQALGERILAKLDNTYLKVLALFSGFNGLIIGTVYSMCDGQSYPYMYHPPGGYKAPILAFSSLAGGGGLTAGAYYKIRKPSNMEERLFQIAVAVPAVIVAFVFGYTLGLFPTMGVSFYNVYSGDQEANP